MKAIDATGENIRNVMNFPRLFLLKNGTLTDQVASVIQKIYRRTTGRSEDMITKIYASLFIVGGLVVATILSYYLNIRLDHMAITAYVKSKLRDSFSS